MANLQRAGRHAVETRWMNDASGWSRSAGKLFGPLIATGEQASFLGSLDLCHTTVVNDELHNAITEAFNFFADERNPVWCGGRGSGCGIGKSGGHG